MAILTRRPNDWNANDIGFVNDDPGYIGGRKEVRTKIALVTSEPADCIPQSELIFLAGLPIHHNPTVLRTIKHLCMGEAAQMDELQRAKAIPHLVALLRHAGPVAQRPSPLSPWRGPHYSEMRNQCVNALYLLCQINRSRQEAAATLLEPLGELKRRMEGLSLIHI